MTVLERLSSLSRSLSTDADNFRHINTACQFFINALPQYLSQDFYIEEEINDQGLTCGLKYTAVTRNGIPCRKVPLSYKRRLTNVNSNFSVTSLDPVYFKENTKLFVKPDPTNEEQAFVYKIPSSFIPDGSANTITEIPNTPTEAEGVILIYAGFLIISTQFRQLMFPSVPTFDDVPNAFSFNFPAIPDLTLDLNIDFSIFDGINYTDIEDTDFSIDPTEIQKGLDALNNAFKFIGQLTDDGIGGYDPTEVPTGAFWLDDEDPEMVQSSTQLAAQEVNRANSYFGNRSTGLQSYRTAIDANVAQFNAKIQKAIQRINLQIQEYQSKLQGYRVELEKHGLSIQEAQVKLQEFQVNVQQRIQKNQQLLERYSTEIQAYQTEYNILAQESVSMFQRYQSEFQNYLNINASQ